MPEQTDPIQGRRGIRRQAAMFDDLLAPTRARHDCFESLATAVSHTPAPAPVRPPALAPVPAPTSFTAVVEPNLRRLRAMVAVAECSSVSRAAERLHVTQSAVTRGVRALEDELGLTLFERSARGMNVTACGQLLVDRARRAFSYIEGADRELSLDRGDGAGLRALRGLSHKVAQRHLQAVSAIADHFTETASALQLGISQPAVTQGLRDLEDLVGVPLFMRTPKGMLPTRQGDIMIRGAKLALSEIAAAGDDLAGHLGQVRGRLTVGALPLSGTQIAPLVVSRVARSYPDLRLRIIEAQYDSLLQSLRCGDVDVIVGALLPVATADVAQQRVFDDELSVVVRQGHPLMRKKTVTLQDLHDAEWVVPFRRTRSRNTVEKVMMAAGLPMPDDAIEANTVVTVRGLLMESNRVSVLSRRQIYYEEREGLLTVLPIKLQGARLPIGYMTRADAQSTVGMSALLKHLREVNPVLPHQLAA
jgi:DNA-binding transcriptional LysR family regulator